MKKGDQAELKMKKVLGIHGVLQEEVHACKVILYDEKKECIFLQLEESELEEISLDAIYECRMISEEEIVSCTGRIKERYRGEEGKMLQFEIENGFYKINIKSVDKQIV